MKIISEKGFQNLKVHKYYAAEFTPFEKYLERIIWVPLSENLPNVSCFLNNLVASSKCGDSFRNYPQLDSFSSHTFL